MKKQEIKLIKDLYNHFQPQTDVTDELINSCYNQYGSIRGILMNLILKFQPNVDVTDEYLDKKLSDYGLLITEENSKVEVVESPQNKKGILKWVIIILVILGLGYFGTNLYFQKQLLQSSLEETKDLYQQELNTNHEEIFDDYYEVYNTYLEEEDYLNLRSEPTSKSINITRMSDGTKLILLSKGNGSNGKWMKVRVLESGKVGYAHTKWIRKY